MEYRKDRGRPMFEMQTRTRGNFLKINKNNIPGAQEIEFSEQKLWKP